MLHFFISEAGLYLRIWLAIQNKKSTEWQLIPQKTCKLMHSFVKVLLYLYEGYNTWIKSPNKNKLSKTGSQPFLDECPPASYWTVMPPLTEHTQSQFCGCAKALPQSNTELKNCNIYCM